MISQKKIANFIPDFIKEVQRKVLKSDGQLEVYGETLSDIHFGHTPLHYQLVSSLDKEKIVDLLDINVPEDYSLSDELELYYSKGNYHLLTFDFVPDTVEEKSTIEISCGVEDIREYTSSKLLPIEQISWDFSDIHCSEAAQAMLDSSTLPLTEDDRKRLSTNIPYLMKYVRLSVKYQLAYTDFIKPSIEKKSWRRFPESHLWKREFIRILELSLPSKAFELNREWGTLPYFFSELLEGYGVLQNEFHEYDVYYHSLSACDAASPDDLIIRLSALFHDIGKPRSKRQLPVGDDEHSKNVFYDHENIGARMTYQILKKFGFHHSTVTKVSKLVRLHMFHYTSEWTDSAVRRLIRKANEDLPDLFKLRAADRLGSGKKDGESKAIQRLERRILQIQEEESRVTVKSLAINGNELMSHFDLTPGPIIGRVLNHLLEIILSDPDQNNPDSLMNHAEIYLEKSSPINKAS
ncbi:MAG: HD domain-containing protein [Spirochaetota bacterium]|nr:HD domain-containing protein [Spirochaetota bacterium]